MGTDDILERFAKRITREQEQFWNGLLDVDETCGIGTKNVLVQFAKGITKKQELYWNGFLDVVHRAGEHNGIYLTRRDIECLNPKTDLNDKIIDYFIKYLHNKIKAEQQGRFYFFNSFFYCKLDAVIRDSSKGGGEDTFQSILRWTKNVDIFQKDFCSYLLTSVLNLRSMDKSSKMPCILHMDSVRGYHSGLRNPIRRYLWEEWRKRGNEQNEDIARKFLKLDFVSPKVPQQPNGFDCGIFLLHFVELFLELASKCSTTKYFDFASQLNEHWFDPDKVSLEKRDNLRKLINDG